MDSYFSKLYFPVDDKLSSEQFSLHRNLFSCFFQYSINFPPGERHVAGRLVLFLCLEILQFYVSEVLALSNRSLGGTRDLARAYVMKMTFSWAQFLCVARWLVCVRTGLSEPLVPSPAVFLGMRSLALPARCRGSSAQCCGHPGRKCHVIRAVGWVPHAVSRFPSSLCRDG